MFSLSGLCSFTTGLFVIIIHLSLTLRDEEAELRDRCKSVAVKVKKCNY
jgi:hypothetical protein